MLCQECSAVAPTRNLFRLSSQPFLSKRSNGARAPTATQGRRQEEEGEGEEGEAGEAQPGDDEQLERKE